MWPGNAGTNSATDHIEVLAGLIAQLPHAWAAGQPPGDDPALVPRRLQTRADSGKPSNGLSDDVQARNAEFSIGWATAHIRTASASPTLSPAHPTQRAP